MMEGFRKPQIRADQDHEVPPMEAELSTGLPTHDPALKL
jgi:hypothetical protein